MELHFMVAEQDKFVCKIPSRLLKGRCSSSLDFDDSRSNFDPVKNNEYNGSRTKRHWPLGAIKMAVERSCEYLFTYIPTSTFAGDTAILSMYSDPSITSVKLWNCF